MKLCVWPALNPLSIHVTFTAIVPVAYPGEAKMCKKCAKMANLWTYRLNYWKRLKIDGYMLRYVWQALNPLSIHVTFTAIVPGAYLGRSKCAKKCAKMANFWTYGLNYWETVEDRWVHAPIRLTSVESSFHPCNIYRDCPRVVLRGGQNVQKCAETDARSVGDSHPSCLLLNEFTDNW